MADKDSGKEKEGVEESPIPSPIPVITEEEKDLASAARADFNSGQYATCLEKLQSLTKMRNGDVKVSHNLMVTKFYQSGCMRNDDLRKNLGVICNQAKISLTGIESLEDTDHAILFFSHSVILYHMRQHHEAIRILEKLFQIIEPLEENLAHKILLLLVETYLCTYQPEKALAVLAYLEKLLFSTDASSNKGGQETTKDNKEAGNELEETSFDPEKYRPTLHLLKTRCYLQMKHVKVCKREIKTVMNSAGPCASSLFLKSNFEYIRQNYRKAIKLLNSVQSPGDSTKTGQCIPVMYFNNLAVLHFYMGKYHLAAYYGRRALQENASAMAELPKRKGQSLNNRHIKTLGMNRRYELLYNTGIQLLHAGRPLAAFECLTEAIQVYPSNPRLWLRLAECCIAAHSSPQSSELENKGFPDSSKRGIVRNVIGSGPHRKVVLTPGSSEYKYSGDGQSAAFPAATLEFASLCLSNALSLLPDDAASATSRVTSRGSVGSDSSETPDPVSKPPGTSHHTMPPGQALKPGDISSLRCSILASSAYVSLSLGDNITALEHAKMLLEQSRLSGSLRFLGHLYAAEALINMDQITEAIQHLAPDSVCDVSVVLPILPEQGDKLGDKMDGSTCDPQEAMEGPIAVSKYYPASIQIARATMLLNLACAHSLRSEWDKAKKCLKQMCNMLSPSEVPEQALFLGIYIELQTGNHQLALQMVKKQQLIPYLKPSQSRPIPISMVTPYNAAASSPQGVFSPAAIPGKGTRSKDPWQK